MCLKYCELLTLFQEAERNDAQRLCDRVPEAMHYIGHAYHNISDIMMHLESAPPRQLRATPVAIGPVAVQVQRVVRHHAIPVVRVVCLPLSMCCVVSWLGFLKKKP